MKILRTAGSINGLIVMALLAGSFVLGFAAIAKPPMGDIKPKTIADLDFTYASNKHMTSHQKHILLYSYLAGHPTPVGKDVCCCGVQVWNTDTHRCERFKNYDESVVVPK